MADNHSTPNPNQPTPQQIIQARADWNMFLEKVRTDPIFKDTPFPPAPTEESFFDWGTRQKYYTHATLLSLWEAKKISEEAHQQKAAEKQEHKEHEGKHDQKHKFHGAPLEPKTMFDDPAFKAMVEERKKQWLLEKKKNPGQLDEETVNYLHGDLDNPEKPTIHTEVEQEFRKKYVDASQYYDEQKKVVYDHPTDDPVLQALKAKNEAHLNARETLLKQKGMGQDFKSEMERMKKRIEENSYTKFVEEHPEKAEHYAKMEGENLPDEVKHIQAAVTRKKEADQATLKRQQAEMAIEAQAKLEGKEGEIAKLRKLGKGNEGARDATAAQAIRENSRNQRIEQRLQKERQGILQSIDQQIAKKTEKPQQQEEEQQQSQEQPQHGPSEKQVRDIMEQMRPQQMPTPEPPPSPQPSPSSMQGDFPRERVTPEPPAPRPAPSASQPSSPNSPNIPRGRPRIPKIPGAGNLGNLAKNGLSRLGSGLGKGGASAAARLAPFLLNPWTLGVIAAIIVLLIIYVILFGNPPDTKGGITGLTLTLEGPTKVENSENIRYVVKATYTGTGDVTLFDPLPPDTVFVSATGNYSLSFGDANKNTVTWKLKDNQPGPDVEQSGLAKNYNFILIIHPQLNDMVVRNKILATGPGLIGTGGPMNGSAVDLENLIKGHGRNVTILGDENTFVTKVMQNGGSYNMAQKEQYLRTIYQAAAKYNVNPLVVLGTWGTETGFNPNLANVAFSCPVGVPSDFASQANCSAKTYDYWMKSFEAGNHSIDVVDKNERKTGAVCTYQDAMMYAMEWYGPECHFYHNNENYRPNMYKFIKTFLGS